MDLTTLLSWVDDTARLAPRMTELACWAYALLAVTTLPPLLPNGPLLITGGVLAARGELSLVLVLLSVAGSALLGDLLLHRLARSTRLGTRRPGTSRRAARRDERLARAAQHLRRRGIPFVIGARFLPAGRLLGPLAAGAAGYPLRRFAVGAALAETVWAGYAVGLGYFGGALSDDPAHALAIGLALSLVAAAVATAAQRRAAHGGPPPGRPGDAP
ncbi:DedA family protein [Streptomyces sp. NPDC127068]|uniref:DedA family protein n=1 Tax=Streptomyces sp. NPDC127068 TaxID=3347127 RepID=UPI00364E37ED